MLFNPHQVIINRDTGEPLVEKRANADINVTHGMLAMRALDAKFDANQYRDERDLKPEDYYKRFLLGTRIMGCPIGETLDLKIEEASIIKDVTAKAYPPGVWGQIWIALDEAAKAPAAKPNGIALQPEAV